jgi:hypothetical protein
MNQGHKIWRLVRRLPLAILVFYMFALIFWADMTFAAITTFSLFTPMFAWLVIYKASGRGRGGLKFYNRLFFYFFGRNNFLWAWMLMFPILFWLITGIGSWGYNTFVPDLRPLTKVTTEVDKVLKSPEQLQKERIAERVKKNQEKYDNYKNPGTTDATAGQAPQPQLGFTSSDYRVIASFALWVLWFFYTPFAFYDEVKASFKKVEKTWFEKSEGVSSPVLYQAMRRVLGIEGPAALAQTVAAGATGGATAHTGKLAWFVGQVLTEAMAQGVTNTFTNAWRRR